MANKTLFMDTFSSTTQLSNTVDDYKYTTILF